MIINMECLAGMREHIEDNSVDAVVCDPPYGLSKEPDMTEVLKHWLAGDDYQHTGCGFMGNSWDSFVPGPVIWKEVLRVLKPGGYLLAFFGSRTYDMGTLAIRLAGFEIRDQIMWVYGSGFPKSLNLGDGKGTALKPAHEPIVMARKPFKGTVAANVQEHGTGALNIDGCRIAHGNDDKRWPANLAHDGLPEEWSRYFYCAKANKADRNYGLTGEATSAHEMVNRKEGSAGLNCPRAGAGRTSGALNNHPTVKPIALMRWLVRLVTPPGGLVLDPFVGSGSTAIAAVQEGFKFVGFEMSEEFHALANKRYGFAIKEKVINKRKERK